MDRGAIGDGSLLRSIVVLLFPPSYINAHEKRSLCKTAALFPDRLIIY